ncbi:hypothetical protein D9757_010375 [Collybiopsis confluens]|uniref:NmrA-like domain-containing protein n=1 Tax=Collybiopsis confluens TaxID=2823264 RepID=A0A8H5GUN7_9AGAR|nr:hypothetical protein D9757_010375 [Collybiopsis confluens]
MSSTRTIAIVGAGLVGTPIARALLNAPTKPKVIILTRPESSGKALPDDISSIATIPVDYSDVAAVTKVFKDHSVDVVVSTLPTAGFEAQYSLANAAQASGTIKLFVPSEWGIPTEGAKANGEDNFFAKKDEFVEHLKSIKLPFTRFYTGFFFGGLRWIAGIEENGKVNTYGKGESKFSATSESDIGGYTAHVLTALPLDSPHLVNKSLRLEGDRINFQDLARIYGKPLAYVPDGEKLPGSTDGEIFFRTYLQVEAEAGRASSGWNRKAGKDDGTAGSTNGLWEGHVWDKVQA